MRSYDMKTVTSTYFVLTESEKRSQVATTMTPVALELLIECSYLGTDLMVGQTAARRGAANFLIRAGLVKFRDAQVPETGLEITERGRKHVERLLALPVRQEPQEGPQNGQQGPAPRFVWGYAEDGPSAPQERPVAAAEALNTMIAAQGQLSNPLTTCIFLEALTWDQQARVLERMGWKRTV